MPATTINAFRPGTRPRTSRWLLAAFTVVAPMVTHAQTAVTNSALTPGDAVDALLRFMTRHGAVGIVNGTSVSKIEATFTRPDRCTLSEVSRLTTGIGNRTPSKRTATTNLPLAQLSPTAVTRPWKDRDGVVSVAIYTSSGDSLVEVRRVSDGQESNTQHVFRHEFTVESPVLADSLIPLVNAAIRSCGGMPVTAEAQARMTAIEEESNRRADALLGRSLLPEVREAALESCRAQVRAKLRSPSDAMFDALRAPILTVDEEKHEMTILGTVEARNGLGGSQSRSYMCSLEKVGSKYLPTSASIL